MARKRGTRGRGARGARGMTSDECSLVALDSIGAKQPRHLANLIIRGYAVVCCAKCSSSSWRLGPRAVCALSCIIAAGCRWMPTSDGR